MAGPSSPSCVTSKARLHHRDGLSLAPRPGIHRRPSGHGPENVEAGRGGAPERAGSDTARAGPGRGARGCQVLSPRQPGRWTGTNARQAWYLSFYELGGRPGVPGPLRPVRPSRPRMSARGAAIPGHAPDGDRQTNPRADPRYHERGPARSALMRGASCVSRAERRPYSPAPTSAGKARMIPWAILSTLPVRTSTGRPRPVRYSSGRRPRAVPRGGPRERPS
jgi:hypothetical protein